MLAPIAPVGGPWPEVPVPEDYERLQQSEAEGILGAVLQTAEHSAAGLPLQVTGKVVLGPAVASSAESRT